jgi:hypothetical protein
MGQYLDIKALAAEVIDSVENEEQEKTAPIGNSLKEAAEQIRNFDDTVVSSTDLQRLADFTKTAAGANTGALIGAGLGTAMAGPLGGMAGSYLGNRIGNASQGALQGGLATGGPMGAMLGATGGALGMGKNTPQAGAGRPGGSVPQQSGPVRTASVVGDELRKIAFQIREQGAKNEEVRLTKAAQMLTAAVGLEHLMEDLNTKVALWDRDKVIKDKIQDVSKALKGEGPSKDRSIRVVEDKVKALKNTFKQASGGFIGHDEIAAAKARQAHGYTLSERDQGILRMSDAKARKPSGQPIPQIRPTLSHRPPKNLVRRLPTSRGQ